MSKDIYIKKTVSMLPLTLENVEAAMTEADGNDAIVDEIKRVEGFLKNIGLSLNDFFGDMGCPYAIDSRDLKAFWTCEQAGDVCKVTSHPLDHEGFTKEIKREEFEHEFINLDDFIETGAYIGKFFRRTTLRNLEDPEFLKVDHSTFVLYANDGVLLSVRNIRNKPTFEVIPRRFVEDGKYEYYGQEKPQYNDSKEVHRGIIKQLTFTGENTQ